MESMSRRASFHRDDFETPGGVYNATPPRIVFGAGKAATIAAEVERLGRRRALVVSTPGRGAMAEAVARDLGPLAAGVLAEAVSQVPIELALRARRHARAVDADCLVSIGGGASIGLGKGIALELALPIVAIPTTYSGSEMTGFCGITIDGVKRMHQSLDMLASVVIYDPELSRGLPVRVSTASTFNALAHCVDAVYTPTVSPVHRLAAIEGAGLLARTLPRLLQDPSDLDTRRRLLEGAYLAGAALTGGFALQHGLAHTLGGSFGVPHGDAHAVVLPYVTAFNAAYAEPEVAALAEAMGGAASAAAALHRLLVTCNLPVSLRDVGVGAADVDEIVRITVEHDKGLNPGPVNAETVAGITHAALDGSCPA
jgi:maleylacetate reductase